MELFRHCTIVLWAISVLALVQSSDCEEDAGRMGELSASNEHDDLCGDYRPQTYLDIQQLTGVWFGNELIDHLNGDEATPRPSNHRDRRVLEVEPPLCVIVDIAQALSAVKPVRVPFGDSLDGGHHYNEPDNRGTTERVFENDSRHSQQLLKLIWDDSTLGTTEYRLQFNVTNRGTWRSEKTWTNGYDSTKTDIQTMFLVMKAVGNHLVLTQCQTVPTQKLQSITLSRTNDRLSDEKIASVRKLLTLRHLIPRSTRTLCEIAHGNASTYTVSAIILIGLSLIGSMRSFLL